ncbi:MAG: sulfur carrier protein ThiS [Myxococcales bacterium]|nr:sulfur carrier protein ThiS [Myxococcales bacterium]
MRIEVNGEAREVEVGCTVGVLIGQLGLGDTPVAVERNAEIVPRARHAETALQEGDRLEIVQFVGGG